MRIFLRTGRFFLYIKINFYAKTAQIYLFSKIDFRGLGTVSLVLFVNLCYTIINYTNKERRAFTNADNGSG